MERFREIFRITAETRKLYFRYFDEVRGKRESCAGSRSMVILRWWPVEVGYLWGLSGRHGRACAAGNVACCKRSQNGWYWMLFWLVEWCCIIWRNLWGKWSRGKVILNVHKVFKSGSFSGTFSWQRVKSCGLVEKRSCSFWDFNMISNACAISKFCVRPCSTFRRCL